MAVAWPGVVAVGCVLFIIVIPIAGWNVARLPGDELLRRLNAARFPRWQRRIVLAGPGWCIAAFAMAVGVLIAIVSSWVESSALEFVAGTILLVWISSAWHPLSRRPPVDPSYCCFRSYGDMSGRRYCGHNNRLARPAHWREADRRPYNAIRRGTHR